MVSEASMASLDHGLSSDPTLATWFCRFRFVRWGCDGVFWWFSFIFSGVFALSSYFLCRGLLLFKFLKKFFSVLNVVLTSALWSLWCMILHFSFVSEWIKVLNFGRVSLSMGSIGDSLTTSTVSISVKPSHPLYLYPSDSPGTVLVSSTFNGLGYGSWRRYTTRNWIYRNSFFCNGHITVAIDRICNGCDPYTRLLMLLAYFCTKTVPLP